MAATFEENAEIKARHYGALLAGAGHARRLLFADDSGLEVDALGGAPGVISARYCGRHGDDLANNRLLIEKLRGVENRTARFVCAIALVEGAELRGVYRGSVEGVIVDQPRGAGGFGYDPHFYYPPSAAPSEKPAPNRSSPSATAEKPCAPCWRLELPEALFGPRVAAHVVAVGFPETGTVRGGQLQPGQPLGALPGVQTGDDQARRAAVLGAEGWPSWRSATRQSSASRCSIGRLVVQPRSYP